MMKKCLLLLIMGTGLVGCVSSSDFSTLQSQVIGLNAKVNSLETQVSGLRKALKEQRVVRLPTGAPTQVRSRMTVQKPSDNASDSSSATQLDKALTTYQQGDIESAVQQLNDFVSQNPAPVYRNKALFYLGEANYSLRQYGAAEQALETLVYQNGGELPSSEALELLGKVYQAQGKVDKMKALTNFIKKSTAPKMESLPDETIIPNDNVL